MEDFIWSEVVVPLVLLVGTLKLINFFLDLCSFLNRQFLRGRRDHLAAYGGKGTWALVTGASDGIGLQFCKQLAKDGFNICLVGRNPQKLQGVIDKHLKDCGRELRTVIADFSGANSMGFYDQIVDKVKDLDIGLVVLNAGVLHYGFFTKIEEPQKFQDMLDTNVYQKGALTHKFVEMLNKRGKPSGIIAVSSIGAQFVFGKNVVYGATKAFVKYLYYALDWEAKAAGHKVDILCLQPHFVETNMIAEAKAKNQNFATVSVTQCVNGALRDLGHETATYGPLSHEVVGNFLTTLLRYIPTLGG